MESKEAMVAAPAAGAGEAKSKTRHCPLLVSASIDLFASLDLGLNVGHRLTCSGIRSFRQVSNDLWDSRCHYSSRLAVSSSLSIW